MSTRRELLRGFGLAAAAGALGTLAPRSAHTAGEEYRVLVVVLLQGGMDGHNVLVPGDERYAEYQAARGNLALPRSELIDLPGSPGGRRFAMHSSLAGLQSAYQNGRLAFLANVGPLLRPVTAADVRAGTAEVPPMLGSHQAQMAAVQGALPEGDGSGWGGRALEALPPELRHGRAAFALDPEARLLHGRRSDVALRSNSWWPGWNIGWLRDPNNIGTQAYQRAAAQQSANLMRQEYGRTLSGVMGDVAWFNQAFDRGGDAAGDWGNTHVSGQLRTLARLLPFAKQQGLRRQICMVSDVQWDLHRELRGRQANRLLQLAKSLVAFDNHLVGAGLDQNVATLVMSEFGRTLRPFSTNNDGSEHGWGNHWMLLGGPVAGGTVHGTFPSLVLGGADDGDPNGAGRLVPTMASDQVAATLSRWLGVAAADLETVLPNLANFQNKTLPLLRA